MNKIKIFFKGFDYAVKNYDSIEDRHFQTLPGSDVARQDDHKLYRKSISIGRKYVQYRYELLTLILILITTLLFMFTW